MEATSVSAEEQYEGAWAIRGGCSSPDASHDIGENDKYHCISLDVASISSTYIATPSDTISLAISSEPASTFVSCSHVPAVQGNRYDASTRPTAGPLQSQGFTFVYLWLSCGD